MKAAYGVNNITFGSVAGTGAGETIAIVDAYNDPNIVSDLATFDKQFGLAAPPSFKVVNQNGGTSLPTNNRGWSSEIALDVEWAHAIAPGANILLVEASSASMTRSRSGAAITPAVQPGVVVVSNSWGGSEYSAESSEDVHFTTPSRSCGRHVHRGGRRRWYRREYPSSSPDVLSVGGSTLRLTSSGTYSSESVWSDGGGGASRYEGLPSYQSGFTSRQSWHARRFVRCQSQHRLRRVRQLRYGGWAQFGGTSAGAPQWAALIAIADQGRAWRQRFARQRAGRIYSLPGSDFHDIQSAATDCRPRADTIFLPAVARRLPVR